MKLSITTLMLSLAIVADSACGMDSTFNGTHWCFHGTLTLAESPYYTSVEFNVCAGQTLTIQPGVALYCRPDAWLAVRSSGQLFANGATIVEGNQGIYVQGLVSLHYCDLYALVRPPCGFFPAGGILDTIGLSCTMGSPPAIYPCEGGTISGMVTDGPTRSVVSGAQVTAVHIETQSYLLRTSDQSGVFLFDNVACGGYAVHATYRNQYYAAPPIAVGNGENATVDMSLPESGQGVSLSDVKIYQTMMVDQPFELVLGKRCVVRANVNNASLVPTEVKGRLRIIVGNTTFGPYWAEHTLAVAPGGNAIDPINWRDALYWKPLLDATPSGAISAEFQVELLDLDNNVLEQSEPIVYNFVPSRAIRLHFIPVYTDGLRPLRDNYDRIIELVEPILEDMLPIGRDELICDVPGNVLDYDDDNIPASDPDLMYTVFRELDRMALDEQSYDDYYVGVYPTDLIPDVADGAYGYADIQTCCVQYAQKYCVLIGGGNNPNNPGLAGYLAHELGHAIACLELVDPGDPELYDRCNSSGNCVLDEWGLVTINLPCLNAGSGISPFQDWHPETSWHDIMSNRGCYSWPRWSPTYAEFRSKLTTEILVPCQDEERLRQIGSYAIISGIVGRDSTVLLFEVENLEGEYAQALPDSGAWRLDWWNVNSGELLQTLWFDPVFERREGLLDYANFFIVTSRPENADYVGLFIGDQEIAYVLQSSQPPIATLLAPNGGEALQDSMLVQWSASDADGDSLRFDVFANRNGGNWEPIAMGITDTFLVWQVNYFPGTNAGRVKVVVSDGWYNTADSSDGTFTIPTHNPVANIESPQDTTTLLATSYLSLSGRASDLENGNIGYDSLEWASDLNGFLGRGSLIQADSLLPGLHTITLTATDQDGNYGYDFAWVNVLADGDRDGIADDWEAMHGLDTTRHDTYADLDLDQLSNGHEYNLGTLPDDTDTDNDGYSDGAEIAGGSDPLDNGSIPTIAWLTNPAALSPIGTLGFNDPLIFSWSASSADDSLRPIRYEVYLDADPNFSNPLIVYADTLLSITAPWQLSVGLIYSWKVKATDLYGHWVWSDTVTFTRSSNPQVPVRITDLTAQVADDTLWLHWSPVTQDTSGNPVTVGMYIVSAAPAVDAEFLPIAYTTSTAWTDTEAFDLEWPNWFYAVEGSTNYNPPQVFDRKAWPGMQQMKRARGME